MQKTSKIAEAAKAVEEAQAQTAADEAANAQPPKPEDKKPSPPDSGKGKVVEETQERS